MHVLNCVDFMHMFRGTDYQRVTIRTCVVCPYCGVIATHDKLYGVVYCVIFKNDIYVNLFTSRFSFLRYGSSVNINIFTTLLLCGTIIKAISLTDYTLIKYI